MEMDYSVSAPFDLVIPPRVRTVAAGINPRRGRRQPLAATTLMSAFPSSRRVNSWLPRKQPVQALPSKAGGTAVMTMLIIL